MVLFSIQAWQLASELANVVDSKIPDRRHVLDVDYVRRVRWAARNMADALITGGERAEDQDWVDALCKARLELTILKDLLATGLGSGRICAGTHRELHDKCIIVERILDRMLRRSRPSREQTPAETRHCY